jgi:hypothetical protein
MSMLGNDQKNKIILGKGNLFVLYFIILDRMECESSVRS